jgi:hypothetical protein
VVLHALDVAGPERDQLRVATCGSDRSPRLGQLDLLDSVGGEKGDAATAQAGWHESSSGLRAAVAALSADMSRSGGRETSRCPQAALT